MKMTKTLIANLVALCLLAAQAGVAFASITLDGTVPTGRNGLVIIQQNNQSATTGIIKFKFSAPTAGSYTMNFCIGPAANPCGSATSYVVSVPGGQDRLAVVDASAFGSNVLTVGQGTNNPLPFSVTME